MNEVTNEVATLRAVTRLILEYMRKNNYPPTHCVLPQRVYDDLVELKIQANRQLNPSENMPKNANSIETVNGLIAIASPYIQAVVVFNPVLDGASLDGGAE